MKPVKTSADDPNRCVGTTQHGQCVNLAEHGCEYCAAHGGVSTKDRDETRSYLLAQANVQRRLAQVDAQLDPVRELQCSIDLIRMMMKAHVDSAKTNTALMATCGPLEKLIQRMESLCKSFVTVQEKLNLLLPRSAVLSLGQQIVQIVIDELQEVEGYEQIVDRIIQRIFPAMQQGTALSLPAPTNQEASKSA